MIASASHQYSVVRANSQPELSVIELMAERFSFPHNVFGRPGAAAYVRALASTTSAGWYAVIESSEAVAAAHLAPYGSDGKGHNLWKVRHLLAEQKDGNVEAWCLLLEFLARETRVLKAGTAKLVTFVGEHEREASEAALRAGFVCEGCLNDFYRLEEQCLIFGRTVSS
ncbi:MAG TPA: hypothetical protein VFS67_03695 [Polyangiaceae bacterium]|nr:hypothetical protein [Polyangiaceae bacterium]